MSLHILTLDPNIAPAAEGRTLNLENTQAVDTLAFDGVSRIELQFPKFTDGRAYSQAVVLRRKGFVGDLRATGDVLIDQLLLMQRCGFSSAALRADQNPAFAARALGLIDAHYQGDVAHAPVFAREQS